MRIIDINESIYEMDPNDPNNPEVLIQGYGRLKLKQIEQKVQDMFLSLADSANNGNWENVSHGLNKGTLAAFIQAITDTHEQLEQIRKRGGKNSRGINKR
jgi:hypothetical protein